MSFKEIHRFVGLVITLVLMSMILIPRPTQASPDVRFGWAKSMGGVTYDDNYSLAVDANKNVYTTGMFQGTVDFDPGVGVFNLTSAGATEIFISKLDQNGKLVWAKRIGGPSDELGHAIAIDSLGNIYIAGRFLGTNDFDPGNGVFNLTTAGASDIFISKLDDNGNFLWAKRIGGTGDELPWNIFVDSNDNIYTTGYFTDTVDFDPGDGISNLISAGTWEIFISKLDSSGNFIWAKSMGGALQDEGRDIVVDSFGNVYTTGYFELIADFDPGPDTFFLDAGGWPGMPKIFVSKLDSSGNFVWAKMIGNAQGEVGYSIDLDSGGNVYTTGTFYDTVDFDPGAGTFYLTSAGQADTFISKLDGAGNFIWAKSIGGTGSEYGDDILIDSTGNVYIAGSFEKTVDFDPGAGTYKLTSAGGSDIYTSMSDASGNFVWAKSMGGPDYDFLMNGFSIDPSGSVYIAGDFRSIADFDPGPNKFNLTSTGQSDIFIAKLDKSIAPTFADVPSTHPYFSDIEILQANGLTGGCQISPLKFCPDQIMTRAEASVFMVRGILGSGFVPDPAQHTLQDDWSSGLWAESWAEAITNHGLSAGCSVNPNKYCPWSKLPREQLIIFGLRMKYGINYLPPAATGTLFADMKDPDYYATAWAEQGYKDGLLPSCGMSGGKPLFCPKQPVTRGLGAYVIVRARNLTMP